MPIRVLALVLAVSVTTTGCYSAAWRGGSGGPALLELAPDELPNLDESRLTSEERYSPGVVMVDGRGGTRLVGGGTFTVKLYRLSSGLTVDEHAAIVIRLVDGSIRGVTLPAQIVSDGTTVTIVKNGHIQAIPRKAIAGASYQTEDRRPERPSRARIVVGVVLLAIAGALLVGLIIRGP